MSARCPLCGEPNRCALAGATPSEEPCWCAEREFPAALLAQAPDRRTCICVACLEAHAKAQEDVGPDAPTALRGSR